MKIFRHAFAVLAVLLAIFCGVSIAADVKAKGKKEGPYTVVEGNVSRVAARMLVMDGQQYPVSMYVRVFLDNRKKEEIPMHTVVNVGKIDQAKLYLVGGKVVKILVEKNL